MIEVSQNDWGLGDYVRVSIMPKGGVQNIYVISVVTTRHADPYHKWDEEILEKIEGQIKKLPKIKTFK